MNDEAINYVMWKSQSRYIYFSQTIDISPKTMYNLGERRSVWKKGNR